MILWRFVTHVFAIVLLCMIDLSELGMCKLEYFSMKELKTIFSNRSLPDLIQIARIDNLKDMVECTVERQYLENKNTKLKSLLQCILKENISDSYTKMDKCQVEFSQYVTHYHFMCQMLKAADVFEKHLNETDCKYDVVCPVYEMKPTTELPSPTTSATAMQPPTTWPERTTAPTDLQPSLPTPLQTTSTTEKTITTQTTTGSPNSSASSDGTHDKVKSVEIVSLRTMLTLSLFFNTVGPLIVYLYMRRHRTQYGPCPTILHNGLHQIPPGVQPGTEMMSSTQVPSASREEVESSHLIQPP
ncbi:uncharacterized protein LOC121503768 isoform X2 [Cheilinus undulatus]|uniref:uncharacterized protein LOC121503768 isoform X2 n=2 Tax=Cheilinus undulatus TaxID=241271 RepID=UPI001BD2DB65|nr:uncharacterized protein LOC121503768 isoform X2 [Cheilinus undulatus]